MLPSAQQQKTLIACRLLVATICISTLVQPFLVEVGAVFTLIGVFEGILAIVLYLSVRYGLLDQAAPAVVTLALPFMCLPMILLSGGANSPYSCLLPIFPFYAILMMSLRFVWIASIVICGLTILLGIFSESIVDLTPSPFSSYSAHANAFWIVVAMLFATAISTAYSRITEGLAKTLRDEANLDDLTNIANRLGIEKILEREARSARSHDSWLSLILLSIDDFEAFNTKFGYIAGDRCLQKVGECLRNAARTRQDFVGRWGGAKFLIVLPDTDAEETKSIAELIRKEIEFLDGYRSAEKGQITATLGCCSSYGADSNASKLLDTVNRALSAGKARGQNRVVSSRLKSKQASDEISS